MSNRFLTIENDGGSGDVTIVRPDGSTTSFTQSQTDIISKQLLDSVLLFYKSKIADSGSFENEFFRILASASSQREYNIFRNVFNFLYYNDVKNDGKNLEKFPSFISNNNFVPSIDTINLFIESLKEETRNRMKEKIFNGIYGEKGNPYNFFISRVVNGDSNLLMLKRIEFDRFKDLEVKSKISYDNIDGFYESFKKAEDDYWKLVKEFYISKGFSQNLNNQYGLNIPASFGLDFSKNMIKIAFNRFANGLVYGIPVFMSKKANKETYSFIESQDNDFRSIMSDSFLNIPKDEIYLYLERMIDDLIAFYQEEDRVIDYNNINDLPDLAEFAEYKNGQFASLDISLFTPEILRSAKFHRYFLSDFLEIQNASAFNKERLVEEELKNLRSLFIDMRRYLLENGNFVE
jgi:hypothetical protein